MKLNEIEVGRTYRIRNASGVEGLPELKGKNVIVIDKKQYTVIGEIGGVRHELFASELEEPNHP